MKEITGKQKTKSSSPPKTTKTKQRIIEKDSKIAKEFNKYFKYFKYFYLRARFQ